MTITSRTAATVAAITSLALAGTAIAASAPTLGQPTIIKAGQKTPVAVPGNHLRAGATLRAGTELRRWLVTMHGPSEARITLRCGPGARHIGLAQRDDAPVSVGVAKRSDYGQRTIRVQFHVRHGVEADGATSSVYALCKTRQG